jgi:FixJ family two-component response regulator
MATEHGDEVIMPGRVVVVHDGPDFAEQTATTLREAAGFDAASFSDPMAALDALENGHSVELLVTCVEYQPGKPNGIALALMARTKRPGIRVLLTGPLDLAPYAEGIGQFIEAPVSVEIVAAAVRLLPPTPARRAA